MSIVSGPELIARTQDIVAERTFQAMLVYANGKDYTVTTPYTTLIADEVPLSYGGYERLEFSYDTPDISLTTNGASTDPKYITWVHNGNTNPMIFDTLVILEKVFAQPLPIYNVVAIQPLGVRYQLADVGDRARFSFRINLKNK